MRLALLIALLLLAGCATPQGQIDNTTAAEEPPTQGQETITPETPAETEASAEPDVTIRLTGGNFYFERDGVRNPDLTVQQGERVRIEFTSTDGYHDWVIDEFDAATTRINEGETATVEFVADEQGAFDYYCSVGRHRENGMEGTLIVE